MKLLSVLILLINIQLCSQDYSKIHLTKIAPYKYQFQLIDNSDKIIAMYFLDENFKISRITSQHTYIFDFSKEFSKKNIMVDMNGESIVKNLKN